MTLASGQAGPTAAGPRRRFRLHRTSIGAVALSASSALRLGLQLAMLPVLVVYLSFQRQVQAGLTSATLK